MKGGMKKAIISLIQWVIVGGIIVFLLYPKSKSGNIKDLAFSNCFKDMSKYSILLCNNEPGEDYGERIILSSFKDDEKDRASKIVDYLSNIKVKEKDSITSSSYLYMVEITSGDPVTTTINVYKDNVIQVNCKDFNRIYQVTEPDENIKSMAAFLKGIENYNASSSAKK